MQITKFKISANQMRVFLLKFKEHMDVCDEAFDQSLVQTLEVNKMYAQFEQTLNGQFGSGDGIQLDNLGNIEQDNDTTAQRISQTADNEKVKKSNAILSKMKNPFTVMRLWLKWEIKDIEAIIEAIELSNEMAVRKSAKVK